MDLSLIKRELQIPDSYFKNRQNPKELIYEGNKPVENGWLRRRDNAATSAHEPYLSSGYRLRKLEAESEILSVLSDEMKRRMLNPFRAPSSNDEKQDTTP